MQNNNLLMKRFLQAALFVLLFGVAGMTKGYAFSFSAVCSTGQTLYYNIIDATNHYVSITCPGTVGTNGWNNYTKPAGQVTLPNIVEYNNNNYIVTQINQYAFYGCTNLNVINIPENVTYIGPYAFWNCPNLSMLYFDATHCTQMYTKVNSTNYSVFNRSTSTSDGPSMYYIILGDNVTNIPNYAFTKSTNLDHLIIPETVANIGMYAFYGCNNLYYIQSFASTPPTLGTYAFYGIPVSVNFILPCNATGAYTAAAGWNNYGVYYGYYYEEFPYWVEVSSNNSSLGSATITQEPDCENNGQAVATATPYTGFVFVNWTKDGNVVSTDATYSFTVTDNVELVANFYEMPITITTTVDPANSGEISGDGVYEQGTTCTLTATANAGYTFAHWIENGSVVSSDSTYSFDVIENRTLVAQFQINSYAVTTSALPVEAGTVSGGGTYTHGESCTLTATPATGYVFAYWTKNGIEVSIDSIYTFTVTESAIYIAHFSLPYTISVSTPVSDYGTVLGGGVFPYGRICSVTATANIGYEFENWTEDGIIVSQTANYSFTVTGDRNLVANFSTGQLNGVFSVGQNSLVGFSKGNLKYQASTNTWRFASKQYDYVGSGNANIASNYTGWIDLFGWGTSGYNHGAVCYQPWSTSQTDSDYYAYGAYDYNLYDQTGKADWGYNAIINGGNTTNTWRTLTKDEWEYVFNMRNTESGIRYVRACVNNVNGVILLPDDWDATYFTFNNINGQGYEAYSGNVISASQWSGLEQHGAVFLPAAGWRGGTSTPGSIGSFGIYWSASYDSVYPNGANALSFDGEVWWENTAHTWSANRSDALSVRLVSTVQHDSFNINTSSNPTNVGTVTGGGCYAAGQYCTLTATPVMGCVFVNWTENGEEVSTSNTLSFTVTEDRSLVANFAEVGSEGMLNGMFSIGHNSIVSFSQGNLQYQASTNTWRFAEHQWDYVGENNANISSTNDGWIDLFGWGTGNNPTNTSTSKNDYDSFVDWGYNPISNGGNATNSKRTLSKDEWEYVFNTRITTSGIRYARAIVNNTNGIILLPDDWNTSYYALNNTNDAYASFHSNTITETQWDVLEQHGAVFLPASGYRDETSIHSVDSTGYYWSSSYNNDYWAYSLYFYVSNSNYSYTTAAYDYGDRYLGCSVRLICPVATSSYSINGTPSPTTGGTISGNDMYAYGQYCTLTATPDVGYAFVNWTENGNVVSTTAVYTFIVNEDRNLVANFTYIGTTGMLAGEFSVDNNSLVCFSQGNLQYQASTGTWRFAPYQYTCIGNNNRYISQTYSGWIDLFGWGTSGWDCGNTYYHPWDSDGINGSNQTLYGPPGAYDLTDNYALSDWGIYNAVSNGGNVAGFWRTLTKAEWDYLFNRRRASKVNGVYSARYAKAKVANVYGVILFPDSYTHPSDVAQPVGINSTGNTGWSGNNYNATAWNKMQAAGAVFLPAAGSRSATTVSTGRGWYWSATSRNNNGYANCVKFDEDNMITYESSYRCVGSSVRLVRSVHQTSSYDINITPNPTEGGMITGIGTYNYLQPCTLTAVPNEGYIFINWTENGNVVSADASYTFTVTGNRSLSANFENTTPTYNISVSANPTEGGTVSGAGAYLEGEICTVIATANVGYTFTNWTKDGEVVSTEATYSFTVTEDASFVANFTESGVTQTTNLAQGWSWWSTYIEMNGNNGLQQLEQSLGHNGLMIKTQSPYVQNYYPSLGYDYWFGPLTNVGLTNEAGYQISLSNACQAVVSGAVADAATHPVTIAPGWNWIGYPVMTQQSLSTALANFTPAANDLIKGQNSSATYYANYGWFPTSFTLRPGQGYMYLSNATENKTLTYAVGRGDSELVEAAERMWKNNEHAFAGNLTVMAVVAIDGEEQQSEEIELGAFVGGECRGSSVLTYFEPTDRWYAMLTIAGEEGEEISFAVIDRRKGNTNARSTNRVVFVDNAVVGNLDLPYEVNFTAADALRVYPNPVERNEAFALDIPKNETVAEVLVCNALGDIVLHKEGKQDGQRISGIAISGVYSVKIVCKSGNVYVGKLIVK